MFGLEERGKIIKQIGYHRLGEKIRKKKKISIIYLNVTRGMLLFSSKIREKDKIQTNMGC